ncbi:MAG TPA: hypothetical protein VNH65_11685 [Candidatus Acidoferrum sp.]|nr:hypothetical protein [Candidatus Acidoferrum sp.]
MTKLMVESPENSGNENSSGGEEQSSFRLVLWPRIVELWITGVLIVFFVVRVLGSQTARVILSRFGFHPVP